MACIDNAMIIAGINARYNWGDKNTVNSLPSANFDSDVSGVCLSNALQANICIYYSNGAILIEQTVPMSNFIIWRYQTDQPLTI